MSIVFSPSAEPAVDVVMIAWRRVDTLRACLESLTRLVDAPPFGVRIVANGATDDVRAFLRDEVVGVTVVELDANIGFGGGCNAAAAGSQAEYLVFLNDDATVDPGWLSALHRTARETGGATGSLLFNTDGTVQEAGGRVLSDGSVLQLGGGLTRAEASATAGLLERREVDYLSAASLLLPRNVFEQLGGFDTVYRPAYYEDVDLCLRLRGAGVSLTFEPESVVTHAAGSSTEGDVLYREWALANARAIYVARWAKTLTAAPSPDAPFDRLIAVLDHPTNESAHDTTATDPVKVALAVATSYGHWLATQLLQVREAAELERRRAEAEHENARHAGAQRAAADAAAVDAAEHAAAVQRENDALRSRLVGADAHIAQLHALGLVPTMKWWARRRLGRS